MVNANMRSYNYSTIGTKDAYGQQRINDEVVGSIKMSINLTSQSVQDNINYEQAQYMGLTYAPVDSTYIIHYGEERLKVLYVNALGRMKQVFMRAI